MKVGIPKEIYPNERRVAATPETVQKIRKLGLEVVVEAGAGDASTFADSAYVSAGAVIVPAEKADTLWSESDIILKVRGPMFRPGTTVHEADLMKPGAALISFFWPAQNKELIERMAARKVTVLAMDAVPRITRAQRMDALSAMANIAGYRAVVEAASCFGRFFPGQVTAAGRVKPAQVLVLGAGVAGLAAIAEARAMGAQVRAFDTRAAAREQVESLGAQFVEFKFEEAGEGQGGYAKEMSEAYLAAEQALIAQHAKQSDIIISTALIPGKPAPQLVTSGAVVSMAHGSVIVDMAAEQGGNCPLTEKDKIVEKFGVTIIGLTDLPSRMAHQASDLYATVVFNLLKDVCPDEKGLALNVEDEIHRGVLVLKDGAPHVAAAQAARAARRRTHDAAEAAAEARARGRSAVEHGEPGNAHRHGARRRAARDGWHPGAARVFAAPHGVPARVRHRLARCLERVARAAHAAHERHERHQRHHLDRRHGRAARARRQPGGARARRRRRVGGVNQRRGWFPRHAAHAQDVPQVMTSTIRALAYLVASLLFILSLRGLSTQETARRGNRYGIFGMVLAVVCTAIALLFPTDDLTTIAGAGLTGVGVLAGALGVGALIGGLLASRVAMTSMPELVAVLHSFVGAAAVLVGIATYLQPGAEVETARNAHLIEIFVGVLVGAVTFSGSIIAFGKLRGKVSSKPLLLPGRHLLNIAALVACVVLAVIFLRAPDAWPGEGGALTDGGMPALLAMTFLALLLGIHLVMAIGGGDMPVVVSLLNSYSGWAAAAAGFMLSNDLLIITGALVGSSGAILSYIMCRAMNRTIFNVILGGFGAETGAKKSAGAATAPAGKVTETNVEQVAELLRAARSVIIVPGYGMTVAQAQHPVKEISSVLIAKGIKVRYAIHSRRGLPAGTHERAARRGQRLVRQRHGDGRDQRRLPVDGCRHGHRRQRHREPDGAGRSEQPPSTACPCSKCGRRRA